MKRKFLFGLIVVVLVACYALFALPLALGSDDTYIGQLTLNTEREYQQFKQEVIASNAGWNRMDVLSSEPPIIVQFSVNVDQDYAFPYGEKRSNVWVNVFGASGVLCVLIFGAWLSTLGPRS